MCICVYAGFLSLILFLWLIFHRYTNSFFCGGVLRETERKIEQTKWRESERERKRKWENYWWFFFFLSTAPFTEFSSFSFHFQSFIFFAHQIILCFFSSFFFRFYFLDTWLITWRSGAEFKFGCARSHADNHGFILDNKLDAVS